MKKQEINIEEWNVSDQYYGAAQSAGLVYFFMAAEIRRVSHFRKVDIRRNWAIKKVFNGFLNAWYIFLITRPLQNIIGPHPWPMIINDARQFFMMAVISRRQCWLVYLHWVPSDKGTPKSVEYAAYFVGFCDGHDIYFV